jgi:hypothetical protein
MRRCRIIIVSPPETKRNSQYFEIKTECYCTQNKHHLTHILDTLNLNYVIKESHEHCKIRNSQHAVKFCQLFSFAKNQICDYSFYDLWRIILNLKLLSMLKKVFPYISYSRECEKCVYYLTSIYCNNLFSSVINNVDKIDVLCYIKLVVCFMVQLCLPKKLIELKNHISIYQIIREQVRVVHPLSKWITTSPKKYRSKLFTNKNIPNTYNVYTTLSLTTLRIFYAILVLMYICQL